MFKKTLFIFIISVVIISCKNNILTLSKPSESVNRGKIVYNKYCLACHQTDGSGVPGMYPPVKGTDWVNGDKERLIKIILEGIKGDIEVKGEIYSNEMPVHNFLSDQQIADLLTYLRSNLGNNASVVSIEEVKQVRHNVQ